MNSLPSNRISAAIWLAAIAGLIWAGCADSRSAEPAADTAPAVVLTDVTASAGLGDFRHDNGTFGQAWAPEIVGAGGGFIDYDGDGWLDVLLVGGGTFREQNVRDVRALWLYRNNGDGSFTDRTGEAGLEEVKAYGLGLAAADYDNDGDEDFFLSTLYENLLFRNDGGVFIEVAHSAGLGDGAEWSTSAIFFDADRDGNVDLYVGGYVDWSPEKDIFCGTDVKVYCTPQEYQGIPGRFYRSNGDGTFTDRTEDAGFLPVPGKVFGVVELDYNGDGWSDLYVTEDTERDLLFENNSDGTFTERGVMSGIAYDEHGVARAGMGADAGVIDTTGRVTLIVGNFTEETLGVYRHTGGGIFDDVVASSKLGHPSLMTLTFGLMLLDVDLDGDLDLLTANGHVQTHAAALPEGILSKQPTQMYLNDGYGAFQEFEQPTGVLARRLLGRGAAHGDYDRDGDFDILVTENNGPAHLWRNDVEGRNFLRVHLTGSESNRDALGTRIIAVIGKKRLERRVRTGSSFLSQSEKTAVFGLDRAERVDTLLVYWPGGRIDRFSDVAANQEVRLTEGQGTIDTVPIPPAPAEKLANR